MHLIRYLPCTAPDHMMVLKNLLGRTIAKGNAVQRNQRPCSCYKPRPHAGSTKRKRGGKCHADARAIVYTIRIVSKRQAQSGELLSGVYESPSAVFNSFVLYLILPRKHWPMLAFSSAATVSKLQLRAPH